MMRKAGFTLIELIVVIGIIAVLMGVAIASFGGGTDSANAAKCMNNLRALANGVLSTAAESRVVGDTASARRFPSAGPYEYRLDLGVTLKSGQGDFGRPYCRGWISYTKSESPISAYTDSEEDAAHAITNGAIWKAMQGNREVYVCPVHKKYAQRAGLNARWSYAMNSYFGWKGDSAKKASSENAFQRDYANGLLPFRYDSAPTTRSRPQEKVLLLAEIPGTNCGGLMEEPDFNSAGSTKTDGILQFQRGAEKSTNFGSSSGESIGFNHKNGHDYYAHVAFADGHVAKLKLPKNVSFVKTLTRALCLGLDVNFDGKNYTVQTAE